MFILSKEDRKMVNVDQVRLLELKKGKGWFDWIITAMFDTAGIVTAIATFNRHSDVDKNKEEAEAVFLELCYTIKNTEDKTTVIDMDDFGVDSIYKR